MRSSRRFSLYRRMASSSPGITRLTISETLASSSSRSSVWEVTVDTSSRKSSSSDRSRNRTALRVVSMGFGRPVAHASACSGELQFAIPQNCARGEELPAEADSGTLKRAPQGGRLSESVSFPGCLYNLHTRAGAHAIGTRRHHGAKIVQSANATRGLHSHARPHGVPHQHDVLHGCARRSEAGGGLHAIGAGRLRPAAT